MVEVHTFSTWTGDPDSSQSQIEVTGSVRMDLSYGDVD